MVLFNPDCTASKISLVVVPFKLSVAEYNLTMSSMADFDPKIKANIAMIPTMKFLMSFQLNFPKPFSWNVSISIAIGARSPTIEKQKAPIRDTNGTMVGTAMAIPVQTITITVRVTY